MDSQLIFQIQNGLILALIYTGVAYRRQRLLHMKMMASAITWDILLILQIELSRKAINTAMNAPSNTWFLNFHIAIAVFTVVLYGVLFYTGRQVYKGNNQYRLWHKRAGLTALVCRTSTFITSFFVVNHNAVGP
jgi:hypothetical protein